MTETKNKEISFFEKCLKEEKAKGKISNEELDKLVIEYQSTTSENLFGKILGQVLMSTNLLKKKDEYIKETWSPFADNEDYEQIFSLGLVMAIKKFDPSIGHFINFCFKYCDGRMSDLCYRSYNGGRSYGNTRTIDKNDKLSLRAVTNKKYVNDLADYEFSQDINTVENSVLINELKEIVMQTISPLQQKIISLNILKGYTMKEVAEKLNMKETSCNHQKTQAFKRLRRMQPKLKDYYSLFDENKDMIIVQKIFDQE